MTSTTTPSNGIGSHAVLLQSNYRWPALRDALEKASAEFAATRAGGGLAFGFAGFRTTTLYLADDPSPVLLDAVSFGEEERGANVWLVVPNDEGVFHGASEVEGIRRVHPVHV